MIVNCVNCNKPIERANWQLKNLKIGPVCSRKCQTKICSDARVKDSPIYNHLGYELVHRENGKRKHREIIEKKLGRRLNSNEIVHHRNGDITCNEDENLEVTIRAEHARIHHSGVRQWRHKLTDEQVLEIISKRKEGTKQRILAREYGVNQSVISEICSGKARRSAVEGYPD